MFELVGSILAVAGTMFFWVANKVEDAILSAFILFFASNVLMFHFALDAELYALAIQFCFFFAATVLGIMNLTESEALKKTTLLISAIFIFTAISRIPELPAVPDINFRVTEVIAATLAVLGNLFLRSLDSGKQITAFSFFIVADVLYVYIGLSGGHTAFTLMSMFFILMSSKGLVNNILPTSGPVIHGK